ncbi:MAG: lipoate--protein ligase family protein [Gemmatirosa sp.]
MRVRLLVSPPLPGDLNMALDDALLARSRATGDVHLRVYAWERPTLSLGRNQRALGLYDPVRLAGRGIPVVRRPTGGRAILHWREVTYSVTAPLGALTPADAPLKAAYARINAVLLAGLQTLGVPAREAVPAGRAPLPDGAPCFEVPTGGELVLDGPDGPRKLVGSAQWREDDALLQHGSILLADDQTTVSALATRPVPPVPPPATLGDALGRLPDPEEVVEALFAAVRAQLDPRATELTHREHEPVLAAAESRTAHYADAAWTWRR